jgi:hypothetical protein
MNIQNELKAFIILIVLLSVWFYVILDYLSPVIYNNIIFAYTIFIMLDTYLVCKYILFVGEKFNGRKYFSLVLIFLATDIIMFPYLIDKSGIVATESGALMSSDVFIYKLLPDFIFPLAKYLLVYVLVPALLLMVARGLTTRRWFWQHVGGNV